QTTPKDVETLVPKFANRTHFDLPQELHRLEQVSFQGKFQGLYNDFLVDGRVETALGKLATRSHIDIKKSLSYKGTVKSDLFEVGKFIQQGQLGSSALDLTFDGQGLVLEDLILNTRGTLTSSQVRGYTYDSIELNTHIAQ